MPSTWPTTLHTLPTIPPPTQVSNITSDALFVLLVEKDAAFMRLAEDRQDGAEDTKGADHDEGWRTTS